MSRKIHFASLLLLLGLLSTAAQPVFAQADPPLTFGNNYFVTGDYVVAGAYGLNINNGSGMATGTINIPDTNNKGLTGTNQVPAGAQIVKALLYWQTVENLGVKPGQPGSGQNGFFRPVFTGGPQTGYAMSGVNAGNPVSWASSGCAGGSNAKQQLSTYRAEVTDFLPQDASGNVIVDGIVNGIQYGAYEVRLPSSGTFNHQPFTLGATLVIIFRVLSPDYPLNSIVIYDGTFAPTKTSQTVTLPVQGWSDAAINPADFLAGQSSLSRLTYIVDNVQQFTNETVYLNSHALPLLYGGQSAFTSHYVNWDTVTWTFDDPNNPLLANFPNPVHEDDSSATTQVIPSSSNNGCTSWAAVIVSTTVKNSDGDGLLDAWKQPKKYPNPLRPGYCDASVNEGVCTQGDANWVDLPGAKLGEKDVFVQLDYMCSSVIGGDKCDTSPGNDVFDPRLTIDPLTGKSAVDKVVDAYMAKGIHLHINPTPNINPAPPSIHAIPEPTCTDSSNDSYCASIATNGLAPFPNQPGVVAWKGPLLVVKNLLVDPDEPAMLSDCAGAGAEGTCIPRFNPAQKDSWHYSLWGNTLAIPNWTLLGGSLVSAVQSGQTVTFTTSTPHHLIVDSSKPNGRVTIAYAITNPSLIGTHLVHTAPTSTTFTIQVGNSTNTIYTALTDPNFGVFSGNALEAGTVSGFSDIGGADSLITLGSWGASGQSWQLKAGTFMHELGHSNGLTHGGFYFDKLTANNKDYTPTVEGNCKSNFQSVMSYEGQLLLLRTGPVDKDGKPIRTVDYSGQNLDPINEGISKSTSFFTFPPLTYPYTFWYKPWLGVGDLAKEHCDGTPRSDNEKMFQFEGKVETLAWAVDQDLNFDGMIETIGNPAPPFGLRGHNDWQDTLTNGLVTAPGINLQQISAAGSMSSSGGHGFGGGAGGHGFGGGAGGHGFGGGSGGHGFGGGAGGHGFGGGSGAGELNVETANAQTFPPQNLTASEGVSPRTVTLNWAEPAFGVIGAYRIYRALNGVNPPFPTIVATVPGSQLTFTDTTDTCNPTGYQYYVTAVLAGTFVGALPGPPPDGQESPNSNIVSTIPPDLIDPLTGCYALNGGSNALSVTGFTSPAAGASFIQGDKVPIAYPVTDDFYPTGGPVPVTANTALVAIGPLPNDGNCPSLASVPQFLNFPGGPGAYPQPFTILSSGVFTFLWDTTNFNAGCYVLEADFDSGQVDRTEVQVTIFESDSNPHILSTTLPTATAGIPYPNVPNATIQESGGTGALTWSVISGTFPPGLSLGLNSGMVSGTATTAGTYNFTVKVTDSLGNFGTRAFTLKVLIFVSESAPPTINSLLPNATAGIPYNNTIQQFGAVGAVTWSITAGAVPPGSFTLTTGTGGNGVLAGTPSTAGTYNFTAQAMDSQGNTGSLAVTLKVLIFVSESAPPTINSLLPNATAGIPYMNTIQQFGAAAGAVTWSITAGAVPPGSFTLTTGTGGNGVLAGTPSTAGTYNFTAQAMDSQGNTGSLAFTLTVLIFVSDSQPFTTTTTLPNAVVGSPYSNTVYESGGVSNNMTAFSWTIVAGSVMPGSGSTLPGLSFPFPTNAAGVTNGTLSGTPTMAGTFTFTAMVTDSAGNTGTQNLTITVFAPAPAPSGLVSWYPFEGTASDLEKINNGNVVGTPQFVPGEVDIGFKPGAQLSGSLITIPDSPTLALPQFTIGAWVRVDRLDNVETMQIVWKGDSTAGDLTTPYSLSVLGSANSSFSGTATVVGTPGPGKVLVILTDGSGTHELDLLSTNALSLGTFHYVAVTADGQKVNLYVDGVLDGNSPASESSLTALPFISTNPLQIGGIQGGPAPGNNFDGVIDELQIWNRVLTPSEISGIFNTVGEFQPAARPAGLVSWWPAEGNYTDIINGYNGVPSGGTGFAPGEVGQAFSFNGVDGKIQVADNANLDVKQITIEAWVKPTTSGHGRPIVQKRSSSNVGGYTFESTNSLTAGDGIPNNGLQFGIWIGGVLQLLQTPANALTINAWQHVAATYDGLTMNIYVNGALLASQATPGGSIDTDSADPLVMGLNVTNASYDWNGFTDEVSLYNRALSSAEIQSIVNAGGAGKAKP